ncbi:MAG: family 78 glycoside hydrolase catalytic domain [Lachnospiraceae bacterium]|jgi:alpha-L-rhamnosidase
MKITHLKTNHLVNPLGYDFGVPSVTWAVEEALGKTQAAARVTAAADPDFQEIVFDTGWDPDLKNTGTELKFSLEPSTRYYWKVKVRSDAGEEAESETAWFETPKDSRWEAEWITPDADRSLQVCMLKDFTLDQPAVRARMYMVGLGLYEFSLNGEKQGEECLLPGFCNYDAWIPYQTFDVTGSLRQGENHIEVMLGDGWYKGWYGLHKKHDNYGTRLALIAELRIRLADGTEKIVATDESWQAKKSPVTYSGIYPGEVYDPGIDDSARYAVKPADLGLARLSPRLDPPIVVNEHLKPVGLIHTPAGETVLDLGQNMVGWLQFRCSAPAGKKLFFQFGEILQDGNFYRGNLRSAKAEFTYYSDGTERLVRQHFTFYGFRYVKITGWEGDPNPDDFEGLVIHSQMERLGNIETSDPLVNQLFHNAWWGQKGNFLDIPTDCPQRDERYGWTGDAQIFSGTACFNADTSAFYTKYGKDVYSEQKNLDGACPDVVPVCNYHSAISTAWGETATVIPWNVYLHYGNVEILRRQFDSMRAWVDYMKRQDDIGGAKRLWLNGFHYGDWLALDGNVKGGVYGATDPNYIASAYYYYSTRIVAKSAEILGKKEEAAKYGKLADEIRGAFFREYFTPAGNLCVDTMTGYVIALYMDLVPEGAREKVCGGLMNKLRRSRYHLETGFVGTPYLCRVLSENGMNEMAYHLLLEKGYPGWLYEVLMGATTVWERWNSVEPDGKISGTAMNSLNHYAYGSIAEWMYREMAGIQPQEDHGGFTRFTLSPKPDYQMGWAKGSLRSPSGMIRSSWKLENGKLAFSFTVPFNTKADLVLPDAEESVIRGQAAGQDGVSDIRQDGTGVKAVLSAGMYTFTYEPTRPYRKTYSIDSPWEELKANPKTRAILDEYYFRYRNNIPFEDELYTFREILQGPFTSLPQDRQMEIDRKLREVTD